MNQSICPTCNQKIAKERKVITGKSKCPFCGGTKTTPYVRNGGSQDCSVCDNDGMISNKWLNDHHLWDCIK